jgi:hypothetical protein
MIAGSTTQSVSKAIRLPRLCLEAWVSLSAPEASGFIQPLAPYEEIPGKLERAIPRMLPKKS